MFYIDKQLNIFDVDGDKKTLCDEYRVIQNLDYGVTIEEGFTLRHYFELFKKYEIFQIFDGYMKDFLEEYEKTCHEIPEYDEHSVDYISICRFVSRSEYDNKVMFDNHITVDGQGFDENGEYTSFAIEFMPIYKLIDIEIRIEMDEYYLIAGKDPEREQSTITIFDFLKQIIWELSFCGTPQEVSQKAKELKDTYDDLNNMLKNNTVDELIEKGELVEWKTDKQIEDLISDIDE
jgi:hypothetical protein